MKVKDLTPYLPLQNVTIYESLNKGDDDIDFIKLYSGNVHDIPQELLERKIYWISAVEENVIEIQLK